MLHIELEPGEKIILEIRRHWFVILGPALFFVLMAIAPFVLYQITSLYSVSVSLPFVEDNIFILTFFFYPIWLLFIWISAFVTWTNYYLDVWYITEKRIIDVEQKGIFYRQISNLPFDKIQDVSVEVRGIIATFLNFGNVHVQTAAEDSKNFIIPDARNPEEIKRTIFALHNKEDKVVH